MNSGYVFVDMMGLNLADAEGGFTAQQGKDLRELLKGKRATGKLMLATNLKIGANSYTKVPLPIIYISSADNNIILRIGNYRIILSSAKPAITDYDPIT